MRHKKPENWLSGIERNGHGIAEERTLGASEQAAEALLMGLRLREGIDPAALAERFEMPVAALIELPKLHFYIAQGLAWQRDKRIGVTPAGMPLLDGLLGELVPAALVSE